MDPHIFVYSFGKCMLLGFILRIKNDLLFLITLQDRGAINKEEKCTYKCASIEIVNIINIRIAIDSSFFFLWISKIKYWIII